MGLLEKKILEVAGYDVKNVSFRTARRFLPDVGERKPAEGDDNLPPNEAAWAVAWHREKVGQHLIAVAHVHMENLGVILGSTAGGEKHANVTITYEFCGYGGMLAYSREGITFYAMRQGERITVPPGKERTIINLDEGALIVIGAGVDEAREAEAREATLEEQFGCPLMFLYEPESPITTCLLNTRYYHAGIIKTGDITKGAATIKRPLGETAAIFSAAPGEKLYRAVCEGREQIGKMGIRLALPENA